MGTGLEGDDAQLAQMGHKSELKRQYSLVYVQILARVSGPHYQANQPYVNYRSMLGLAFAILNVCDSSGIRS